ncbi:MAG: UDP-2,3-diacylglucosamine diphosphatase LpxI [Alphaproteobacteria bacterium]|nr:UDP-2,3-diacylglucosamine diphosphatase LpxI [Alphaproteobacteria bacterium]
MNFSVWMKKKLVIETKKEEKNAVGIIAGSGMLPVMLAKFLKKEGRNVFIISLKGQANKTLFPADIPLKEVRLGAVGKTFHLLKKNHVKEIVFIGGVKRPSLKEVYPDLKGFSLLTKLSLKALGDDGLLRLIISEVEQEGFVVKGIHELMPEVLVPAGVLTNRKPTQADLVDIERAREVAKLLGQADVGQAVIVQQGMVLSLEGIEGTKELIKRTKALKRKGDGGVLYKAVKPNQEKRIDMPTIGPDTVQSVYDAGFIGIGVDAGNVLLAEPEKTIELANKLNIFIVGVTESEPKTILQKFVTKNKSKK